MDSIIDPLFESWDICMIVSHVGVFIPGVHPVLFVVVQDNITALYPPF